MNWVYDIPKFDTKYVNERLVTKGIGDAYQALMSELYSREHPNLNIFPSEGKDGAIDFSWEENGSFRVAECKHVGEDGVAEAKGRWGKVTENLKKNLADPDGPPKGQAQYGPWYRTDKPIRQYHFCISSFLKNQNQIDDLEKEIKEFFNDLITQHAHLQHLKDMTVRVVAKNGWELKLKERPVLVFKWFPVLRPGGLVPLDESTFKGTFRSYLSSEKLPYYSRAEHMGIIPAPRKVEILDEAGLLGTLEKNVAEGIILSGRGGVGKSRLMIEVGHSALKKGWLVLRIRSGHELKEEALERLTERVTPETKVLLLIDYVETVRRFTEIVETFSEFNDRLGLCLRYVGTCRSSHYHRIAMIPNHKKIDLTPLDSAREWFESYRKYTVRHILNESGMEVKPEYVKACHDMPILAVFIAYLYGQGRGADIAGLIEEKDFGRWVLKRVRMSFGENVEHRDLALLIAQFPVREPYVDLLEKFGRLFDTLATDGWIEKRESGDKGHGDRWEVAHDVLADEILISYFQRVGPAGVEFINNVFSIACDFGCLRSALFSVERIADHPPLDSFDWSKIIEKQIKEKGAMWRDIRDILLRTSLLNPGQQLALLGRHGAFWDGAERETGFQNVVGWLTRHALDREGGEINENERDILVSWLRRTAPHVTKSNYVLNWGLRFCPAVLRDEVLKWIRTHPQQFQTHFLLVAWLEGGLPSEDIASEVKMWLEKFGSSLHVSFVVEAWLGACGEKEIEFVRDDIKTWLEKNKTIPEAQFVYKSWLDAKGEIEFVRDDIKTWLEKNKTITEAEFVYKSWLDAKGEIEFVRDDIKTWLEKNKTIPEAGFVYKSWLDAKGEIEFVCDDIKTWLEKNKTIPEAGFVYKSWLDAKGEIEFVCDDIKTWLEKNKTILEAGFVYTSWLDAKGEIEFVRDDIKTWLEKNKTIPEAQFVYKSWLDAKGEIKFVCDDIKTWLEKNKTIPEAQFVYKSWLDAGGEFSTIKEGAIDWLHKNCEKREAVYITKLLVKQDISHQTVKDILTWCRKFPDDEDVLWRLTSLGDYLFMKEISEDLCETCEVVMSESIVRNMGLDKISISQVNTLFCFLVNAKTLQHGPLKDRVDALLLVWLRHPDSFGVSPKPHGNIQRPSYFLRVKELISWGRLNVKTDRDVLERFLSWVNLWDLKWKRQIRGEIEYLNQCYPSPGLWEIVEFGGG